MRKKGGRGGSQKVNCNMDCALFERSSGKTSFSLDAATSTFIQLEKMMGDSMLGRRVCLGYHARIRCVFAF